jgi:alpha-glucosidase
MSQWWQTDVIYQIYPRSFKDSNGDGIGDLQGIIDKLDYLKDLGIGAIWISPFFTSPMKDFGYDVADYCDVDPMFGDLATFDRLVQAAHARNIKVLIDWVPNHTSDEHAWFKESRSSRDNPKRDWYVWKDAKPDGSLPNNWGSHFGGPVWEWDEHTQQYYFHLFATEQPDLNWRNPEVQKAMFDVMHFWLKRGVDGFRVDVVYMIWKHPDMPDQPLNPNYVGRGENDLYSRLEHPYDQDYEGIHVLTRQMRVIADSYGDILLVGEIWLAMERWKMYFGTAEEPEFQLPFNFRLLMEAHEWSVAQAKAVIRDIEGNVPEYGFPNYVLNNHDRNRITSRIGIPQARLGAMMLLTLRGTPTIYNGEEIGMVNGMITQDQVQDPQGKILGVQYTRDVCRTPMQWDASEYAGFSSHDTWLPVNPDYLTLNVEAQHKDPTSILALYKKLMQLRKEHQTLTIGRYTELESPHDTMLYERTHEGKTLIVVLNWTSKPLSLRLKHKGKILLDTGLKRVGEPVPYDLELWGYEGVIVEVIE